jgi:tryptophan 2,3-dioxygenase
MSRGSGDVYYAEYLELDKLLATQHPVSDSLGKPAHDELLFIIVHQTYELWFKLVLFELDSVIRIFDTDRIDEKQMGVVISRLDRVHTIQQTLVQQIDVIETMTPMDFLEFRDLLVPASGFQSVQFKQIEARLGLKRGQRLAADQDFIATRLNPSDQRRIADAESQANLFDLTERWLARMPFLNFAGFDFWQRYREAVGAMLDSDEAIVRGNAAISLREREFQLKSLSATRASFDALLNEREYQRLRDEGQVRMSQRAFLSAIFIYQYRDEPILFLPFQYLTLLVKIDEMLTRWRARHAIMVQRMLGTKIGTGGSSGHDYLAQTTEHNRVFLDLYRVSTYLIRRSALPELPASLRREMGFQHDDPI